MTDPRGSLWRRCWRTYAAWPLTPWKVAASASVLLLLLAQVWAVAVGVADGIAWYVFVAYVASVYAVWLSGAAWVLAALVWSASWLCRRAASCALVSRSGSA